MPIFVYVALSFIFFILAITGRVLISNATVLTNRRRIWWIRISRWILYISAGYMALMAIFINWATSPPILPKPTGPYSVAVSEWQIKTNRDEVYTLQPGDKRQLHIKIWYPTDNWQTLNKGNYKPTPQLANYTSTNMAEVHATRISQFGPISFLKQPLMKSLAALKLDAYAGSSVSHHKDKY